MVSLQKLHNRWSSSAVSEESCLAFRREWKQMVSFRDAEPAVEIVCPFMERENLQVCTL